MKGIIIVILVLLSALFIVGCTSRSEYVPILINNGCSNSTTGECNCTVDRATIYSFLTDYNTTNELQEIFYPYSNPYNFINETTDSLNDTFSCDNADYYITSINISNGNITGVCAFDSEGESTLPDGTGGWVNDSVNTNTSLKVYAGSILCLSNTTAGSYPCIEAKNNSDGERSITLRTTQSADFFLGNNGFFNIYNSSGSWQMYVRSSTGQITTRTEGTSTNWYTAYTSRYNYYGNMSILQNDLTSNASKISAEILDRISNDSVLQNQVNTILPLYQASFSYNKIMERDMCGSTSVTNSDWYGVAIGSGTTGDTTGYVTHPCVITLSSSTTASSGYVITTGSNALLLAGNESTDIIFKKLAKTGNVTLARLGFLDSKTNVTPVDGVWFNLSDLVLRGQSSSNSARSYTASNYNITDAQWYRARIEIVNSTLAIFYLYNSTTDAGAGNTVLLWTDNITSNIPTTTGRQTGHGVVAWVNGTTTAQELIHIDYMNIMINRSIIR